MAGAACRGAAPWRSAATLLLTALCIAAFVFQPCHAEASQRDHYEVLGISPEATAAEVKRAYKQLALRYHPDKNRAEDAEQIFIEVQKAYEVLSDPERRRRYDTRSRFFSNEEHNEGRDGAEGSRGAPDFGRGSVFDAAEEVKAAVSSDNLWLFHVYVDRHNFFGTWILELPQDFKLGHLNLDRTQELAGVLREMHGGRLGTIPFLMVCQSSRCRSFVPNSGGFFMMFRSVNEDVVEEAMHLVDYWRHLANPRSDEELRRFAEFQPGGSARLRLIMFVEDEGERHFSTYSVSHRLRDVAHVAQFRYFDAANARGEPQEFLGTLGLTRLPCAVVLDPLSGDFFSVTSQRTLANLADVSERLLRGERVSSASRLFPIQEFDADAYKWRCGDGDCSRVALLATPAALESDGQALADALGAFTKACESLAALRNHLPQPVACFWLRLGRAPAWDELFRPYRRGREVPFAALLGPGIAGLAPEDVAFNSRALFRWFRDGLGHGGPRDGISFSLTAWPTLPKALGWDEDAQYGLSWARRVWRRVRAAFHEVKAAMSEQFQGVEVDDNTILGLVLLVLSAALFLWYFMGEDEPPAEPTLAEALETLEFQITVGLRREGNLKIGIGIAGTKQGGLEITSIMAGGLLEAWNAHAPREERRVRPGDRIVCVSWCEEGRRCNVPASSGAELLAKALQEVRSTEIVLSVLPGETASCNLRRLEGTVTLDGLTLKDCARFAHGTGVDGSSQLDLEVVAIKAPLAEWNLARLREGACCTQRLEVGDRVVAVGGHTDCAQHLTERSPKVFLAKWRPEAALSRQRFEMSVERSSPTERWGMHLGRRIAGNEALCVVQSVAESSLVGQWNASSASSPGRIPVLPGDRLLSVNGEGSLPGMSQEMGTKLLIRLQVERWLEPPPTNGSAPHAAPAAPEDETAQQQELSLDRPRDGGPPGPVAHDGRPPERGQLGDDGWDLGLEELTTNQPHHSKPPVTPAHDGSPPEGGAAVDGWELVLEDFAAGAEAAEAAGNVQAAEAAGGGPPARVPAPPATSPAAAPVLPPPASSAALDQVELAPEPVLAQAAERPAAADDGWDFDFDGFDDAVKPAVANGKPPPVAAASPARGFDDAVKPPMANGRPPSARGTAAPVASQAECSLGELDLEELVRPSRPSQRRAEPRGGAAAEAEKEAGLPAFATVDAGGAWLQTQGVCVLAARGSSAYLQGLAALVRSLEASGAEVAFFCEPRLPSDSLLVVLSSESRCRWLHWRGLDGSLVDCHRGPVAEARELLERVCTLAREATGPPPSRPLLPLRFEAADFARRAYGSCLARPAG